jgi:hypothetical protein
MMRSSILLQMATIGIVLLIGFSAALGQPAPQQLSAFDQELMSVETRFIAALQAKDVAYAERTTAPDFQGVALNGDSLERRELIDDARDGMAKDARVYGVQMVRLSDNCAVVSYSVIVPGDHPRYRHVSDTWAKEGGEWKVKFEQRTPRVWSALDLD